MKQILQSVNGPMRPLALAGGGSIVAAIVTMFLPVSLLEAATGSTGLSELLPSTAAPLGDTARALIAFGTGIMVFAILALLLAKKKGAATAMAEAEADFSNPFTEAKPSAVSYDSTASGNEGKSLLGQVRSKLADMFERARGKGEVTDFADLPKLRNRDIHPDAPARQPISAHRDFGDMRNHAPLVEEVELPGMYTKPDSAPAPVAAPVVIAEPVAEEFERFTPAAATDVASEPVEPFVAAEPIELAPVQSGSLSQMVDNLEAVLASRKAQLEQLEDIARRAVAQSEARADAVLASTPAPVVPVAEDNRFPESEIARRLEAVEPTGAAINRPRNGDDALRSALETLHRMNARSN